jgi:hypothetical protein
MAALARKLRKVPGLSRCGNDALRNDLIAAIDTPLDCP